MTTLIRRTRITLECLALAACATSCVSLGRHFPSEKVPSITVGKSSQSEIFAAYGPPFRTGIQDGDVTWTYVNYKFRLFGRQCTQDLVLRFDASGTVRSFTYNTTTTTGDCG